MAARPTFALKAGLCVRRARLAIVTPDMRHSRRSQADFPLIGLSEFAPPPLGEVRQPLHRRLRLYARARRPRLGALQPANLGVRDAHEHARFAQPNTDPEPGLPDLWEAAPQGRVPDALYREMASLL